MYTEDLRTPVNESTEYNTDELTTASLMFSFASLCVLDPVQEVTSIDLTSRMFKLQTLSNSH
jgi:hypothetical protein